MTTSTDMAHPGQRYGYADQTSVRTPVRDTVRTGNLGGKDVVGVLLAVVMLLGPLAAGAFGL